MYSTFFLSIAFPSAIVDSVTIAGPNYAGTLMTLFVEMTKEYIARIHTNVI